MSDLVRMLSKVSYKELSKICGEEELPKSGKKLDLVHRLVENLPEDNLRGRLIEFMGVSKKIKEHNLVPKHKVLTKEQIDKIIEKFGIKKWQLPKLLDKDPVVLLAGARPGDVLKIDRISETAGESTYYRLVVRSGN